MGKRKKKWIAEAVEKPGSLKATVRHQFGKKGFTKRGTIKVSVLRDLAKNARSKKTKKRANLALTMRGFRK